jgi:hypothetical protein
MLLALPLAADETDRGGSLSLEPGVLMPIGTLAQSFYAAPQEALDFDVGINPRWSVIFGLGFSDHESVASPDAKLVLAPVWMGFKSKAQFSDAVEVFWDLSAEGWYEKEYLYNAGVGSVENLDGGASAGAGFDLLLTKWLLVGCVSRCHMAFEEGHVYPFVQLALRFGLRG